MKRIRTPARRYSPGPDALRPKTSRKLGKKSKSFADVLTQTVQNDPLYDEYRFIIRGLLQERLIMEMSRSKFVDVVVLISRTFYSMVLAKFNYALPETDLISFYFHRISMFHLRCAPKRTRTLTCNLCHTKRSSKVSPSNHAA